MECSAWTKLSDAVVVVHANHKSGVMKNSILDFDYHQVHIELGTYVRQFATIGSVFLLVRCSWNAEEYVLLLAKANECCYS